MGLSSSLVTVALVALSPAERKLVDRIAAVVNDDIITLSDVERAAAPYLAQNNTEDKKKTLYKDVLDQLINEQLLSQQVTEAKISVSDDEVDRAIKDILKQNNISEDELRQAVEQRGLSMGQYREDLKRQLVRLKIVDLKVRSRVNVPDTEVKAEYDRMMSQEKREELIGLRHIFFRWGESPDPTERRRVLEKATKARERITGGEDFARVAKEISEGPTASQGGDLGEVSKKGLLPELAKAIQSMQVGEVSEPIETKNGVHVVRIESRKTKDATPFIDMRNQIYQKLYQAEVERQMKIWLDELRSQSAIDVRM
jgi:peptidyl-prolyl cis-trans isomerase SurA